MPVSSFCDLEKCGKVKEVTLKKNSGILGPKPEKHNCYTWHDKG